MKYFGSRVRVEPLGNVTVYASTVEVEDKHMTEKITTRRRDLTNIVLIVFPAFDIFF